VHTVGGTPSRRGKKSQVEKVLARKKQMSGAPLFLLPPHGGGGGGDHRDQSWSSFLLEELHAVVAALVGGARYGLKIRVPHAVVMTALFKRDLSAKQKLRQIIKVTGEHAANLAAFATVYKCMLSVLKYASRQLHQRGHNHDAVQRRGETTWLRFWGKLFVSLLGTCAQ